jgi:RNA polymerase sigma-70 factor (ECF subfamily)
MDSLAEERTWIARAREGDAEAFRVLVDRHRDRVYGLALRIVGRAEDAEEAAQDAFVRAWRALPEFRGEAAFGTWLHKIVVRLAIERATALRARARRQSATDELPEVAAGAAGRAGGSGGDGPGAGEGGDPILATRLERMLSGLGDVQRAAVVLYHLEDRPVLEVADVLGLPESTVKTHLARARAALKTAWERESLRTRPAHEETR